MDIAVGSEPHGSVEGAFQRLDEAEGIASWARTYDPRPRRADGRLRAREDAGRARHGDPGPGHVDDPRHHASTSRHLDLHEAMEGDDAFVAAQLATVFARRPGDGFQIAADAGGLERAVLGQTDDVSASA